VSYYSTSRHRSEEVAPARSHLRHVKLRFDNGNIHRERNSVRVRTSQIHCQYRTIISVSRTSGRSPLHRQQNRYQVRPEQSRPEMNRSPKKAKEKFNWHLSRDGSFLLSGGVRKGKFNNFVAQGALQL
jgi:hypothetical protein